jgi:hypothetical protein
MVKPAGRSLYQCGSRARPGRRSWLSSARPHAPSRGAMILKYPTALLVIAADRCACPVSPSHGTSTLSYWPVVTHSAETITLARPGEFLIDSFQPFTAQPASISSSTAEPDLLHNREVGKLEADRISGPERRNDHVDVWAASTDNGVTQSEGLRLRRRRKDSA